jgi:hypothetical protein
MKFPFPGSPARSTPTTVSEYKLWEDHINNKPLGQIQLDLVFGLGVGEWRPLNVAFHQWGNDWTEIIPKLYNFYEITLTIEMAENRWAGAKYRKFPSITLFVFRLWKHSRNQSFFGRKPNISKRTSNGIRRCKLNRRDIILFSLKNFALQINVLCYIR